MPCTSVVVRESMIPICPRLLPPCFARSSRAAGWRIPPCRALPPQRLFGMGQAVPIAGRRRLGGPERILIVGDFDREQRHQLGPQCVLALRHGRSPHRFSGASR